MPPVAETQRRRTAVAPALVRSGLSTGMLFLVRSGVAFLTMLVATRSMGAAGRGQFAVWMTTGSLVAIVAYSGLVPALRRCSDGADGVGLLRAALAVVTTRTTALLVVALPAVVLLVAGGWTAQRVAMVAVLAFVVALQSAVAASSAVVHRDGPVLGVFLSGSVLLLALVVAASVIGEIRPELLLGLWLVTGAAAVLIGVRVTGFQASELDVVTLMRSTWRASPAELGLLISWRVDVLVLGAMTESSDVGRYAVAVAFAEIPFTLMTGLRMALLGKRGDGPDAQARLVRRIAVAAVVIGPLIGVAAAAAIRLLFGSEFGGLTTTCAVLMPGAMVLGIAHILIDSSSGGGRRITVVTATSLVVNLTLNVALIGPLGIAGAAVASAVSYALAAAGVYFVSRSHKTISPSDGEG